jgi:hypothetical protein
MSRDGGDEHDPEKPSEPGWYPDPWSATGDGERYFDGEKWGSSERPLGRLTVVDLEEHRKQRGRRNKSTSSASTSRWRLPPHLRPVALLIALVLLIWGVPKLFHHDSGKQPTVTEPNGNESPTRPPASQEEAAHPIGHPATVPAGTGQYEVKLHQPDDPNTPVAFDPCRPVHYVINMNGAPADGLSIVQSAVARVQTATGLRFVYDGTTDEVADKERQAYQPTRYRSDRWAPVLIAWANEKEFAPLAGYIDGVGAADPYPASPDRLVYVSGEVVLDRDQLSKTNMPNRQLVRATVLHELGHLVGLDHTSDRQQIMFSESQFNVKNYGVGDLRGLAALGTQACFPSV